MRFGYIFKQTQYVRECQILQDKLGEMTVVAVLRDSMKKEEFEERIRKEIKIWISPTIIVKFEYVGHIERTKAGKFKAVVSTLS